MRLSGWIFMIAGWVVIAWMTVWSFKKILRKKN